jgi:23S rRNA (adenine2503-C2)-methyltransferase
LLKRNNIKDLTLPALRERIIALGAPSFRANQIFGWLYKPGIADLKQMTNIGGDLQKKLEEEMGDTNLRCLSHVRTLQSGDGTHKFLFRGAEEEAGADVGRETMQEGRGPVIETVLMKYRYGNSVCISSQAGCRMGCAFCASGLKGLVRNLRPGEMMEQILLARDLSGLDISHVVVMGTGEPMDNLTHLKTFLEILCDPKGLGLSRRRVTVSTCGLIPEMETFWRTFPQVGLAVSLHAPDDEIRNALIPAGRRAGVGELLAAAARYVGETGRRITFEYALIKGVNDDVSCARALAKRLAGLLCHVNLIPLNGVEETGLQPASRETVAAFQEILETAGIQVTQRRELGRDIAAACGQLRLQV